MASRVARPYSLRASDFTAAPSSSLTRCRSATSAAIGHLADEVLASHRGKQPCVRRVFRGEIVDCQAGGDRCGHRIPACIQRLQEARLRPAHPTQPHRRQQVVDTREPVIHRAFGRTAESHYPVDCDAARTVAKDEVAGHVQDLVDGMAFRPGHESYIRRTGLIRPHRTTRRFRRPSVSRRREGPRRRRGYRCWCTRPARRRCPRARPPA